MRAGSRQAPAFGVAGDGRGILLDCLNEALAAVDARRVVANELDRRPLQGQWHVIAIGKAAGAMCLGACDGLGGRLVDALVITAPGHRPPGLESFQNVRVLESSHPMPDDRSLRAGLALAEYVRALPAGTQVLVLVSGGASSLVELPLAGLGLEDLRQLNAWALESGLDIVMINRVRRRMSRLKGGGLARLLGSHRVVAYFISDVPADDPAVIGSGLLHASADGPLPDSLPPKIRSLLERAGPPDSLRGTLPQVPHRVLASNRDACRAAAQAARRRGLRARVVRRRFAGRAAILGGRFARAVLAAEADTLLAWGGESTVRLSREPGRGGRNQHLALSAATVLSGRSAVWLLSVGTDGVDGSSCDAGALVDGGSCARGIDAGLDPRDCLERADSGRFLDASGDLIHTGPTLTNVGDLVLGLRLGEAA